VRASPPRFPVHTKRDNTEPANHQVLLRGGLCFLRHWRPGSGPGRSRIGRSRPGQGADAFSRSALTLGRSNRCDDLGQGPKVDATNSLGCCGCWRTALPTPAYSASSSSGCGPASWTATRGTRRTGKRRRSRVLDRDPTAEDQGSLQHPPV